MTAPTRTARGLAGAIVVGLLLAACGAGSKHPPSTTSTTTPTTPAAARSSPLAVYLLRKGEGGFQVSSPIDQTTAGQWMTVSQSTPADVRRVQTEGFREALEQPIATTSGGTGLDFVLELGSASDARREQAAELQEDIAEQGHVRIARFTVTGIPGSDGIAASEDRKGTAANVLFTEGRCLLLVGDGEAGTTDRARAIAGARAIYTRTDATPGACTRAGSPKV